MAKENKGKEAVKEEEEDQPAEPKKKSNLKLIIIIVVVLVVVIAGAVAAFFLMPKSDAKKPVEKPKVISILPMDQFVVNIAETNGERYLKIVLQLEVSDPEVGREIDQFKPRIRDGILDLLTSKTFKELMDLTSKQRLREDIAGRINNILQQGKVTKVYITEFVIQ